MTYRQYMQARDKYAKSLKSQWRAAMLTVEGVAMSTRNRKAARKRLGLR